MTSRVHAGCVLLVAVLITARVGNATDDVIRSRDRQLDLIASLQLWNNSYAGVSSQSSDIDSDDHGVIHLSGINREVQLPEAVSRHVTNLWAQSGGQFAILASVRHNALNAATIVALACGEQRLLEVQSSGRTGEVRFHYISGAPTSSNISWLENGHQTNKVPDLPRLRTFVHVESFKQQLADGKWHRLAISVSGTELSLFVDCHRVATLTVPSPLLPTTSNASLCAPYGVEVVEEDVSGGRDQGEGGGIVSSPRIWLGQRNKQHFLLQGSLRDVKMVFGARGYTEQCGDVDIQCPACDQHGTLQQTVHALEYTVQQLSHRLKVVEETVKQLERCQCGRSCAVNGTTRSHQSVWTSGCQRCTCLHGKVECRPEQCPAVTCAHPYYESGNCCPKCRVGCHLESSYYEHGQRVLVNDCVSCVCMHGALQCAAIELVQHCPPLNCPQHERVKVSGQCCQFCRGDDICAGVRHNCHEHATCITTQSGFRCECRKGFTGDGVICEDINECERVDNGDMTAICGSDAICINTVGSFHCQCRPGFERRDNMSCVDQDECARQHSHECHADATCMNTRGTYTCTCQPGFSGDGRVCEPVCEPACENGGRCVAPGVCACRRGFTGIVCGRDIDECSRDLHQCGPHAICNNLAGWYRCQCNSGLRPRPYSDVLALTCTDVDECTENTHTCHEEATCRNTNGSYTCHCLGARCDLDCLIDGSSYKHGSTWRHVARACHTCRCEAGVTTCTRATCNCSDSSVDLKCCPRCMSEDSMSGCSHQTLASVRFNSGDLWLHNCQQCQCVLGTVRCWPVECPPVNCLRPVWSHSDCCPRCSDSDNCAVSVNNTLSSLTPAPCHVQYVTTAVQGAPQTTNSARLRQLQTECVECDCKAPFCDRLVEHSAASCVTRANWPILTLLIVAYWLLKQLSTQTLIIPRQTHTPNTSTIIAKKLRTPKRHNRLNARPLRLSTIVANWRQKRRRHRRRTRTTHTRTKRAGQCFRTLSVLMAPSSGKKEKHYYTLTANVSSNCR